MIYGVEKSEIKKYPYCKNVHVNSVESTRRYIGKTKNHRRNLGRNMRRIKFLLNICYTEKNSTDFGTLMQKSHSELSQSQIVSKYHLVLGFIFLKILARTFVVNVAFQDNEISTVN